MRPRLHRPGAAFLLLAICACGDRADDIDDRLVGEWVVVRHIVTNATNSSQVVDLVADEHWGEGAIFLPNGHYAGVRSQGGGPPSPDAATWTADGTTLTFEYPGEAPFPVAYNVLSPTRFTIEVADGEGWDFDGDQVLENTSEEITLVSTSESPDVALVGDWVAQSYVLRAAADASKTLDVIAGGGALSLSLAADGGLTYDETWVDGSSESRAGSYVAIDDLIRYQDPPDNRLASYSFDGPTLVVTAYYDAVHDFGDGPEPAHSDVRLTAQ